MELRLKQLILAGRMLLDIPPNQENLHHGIDKLWKQCRSILGRIHAEENLDYLDDIERYIAEFARVDPSSTAFRYPTDKKGNPSLEGLSHVNLRNLSETMERIAVLLDGASLEFDVLFQAKCEMESWCRR